MELAGSFIIFTPVYYTTWSVISDDYNLKYLCMKILNIMWHGKCFVGWHINCQCYQKRQETLAYFVSPSNRSNLELSLNFFDDGVIQHSVLFSWILSISSVLYMETIKIFFFWKLALFPFLLDIIWKNPILLGLKIGLSYHGWGCKRIKPISEMFLCKY